METRHVLPDAAIEGLELPRAALDALTTSGLPQELRLRDWGGPTLFTSEIGGGRLVATSDPGALVTRAGPDEGYVVGSVRETLDEEPTPYAVFALRRGTGEVWLLDVGDPANDRFVNTNLTTFLASLDAFHAAFARLVDDAPDRGRIVDSFRALLATMDARALAHEDHYWPGWLEELDEGA